MLSIFSRPLIFNSASGYKICQRFSSFQYNIQPKLITGGTRSLQRKSDGVGVYVHYAIVGVTNLFILECKLQVRQQGVINLTPRRYQFRCTNRSLQTSIKPTSDLSRTIPTYMPFPGCNTHPSIIMPSLLLCGCKFAPPPLA